jgi:hypothetical protein
MKFSDIIIEDISHYEFKVFCHKISIGIQGSQTQVGVFSFLQTLNSCNFVLFLLSGNKMAVLQTIVCKYSFNICKKLQSTGRDVAMGR